MKFSYKTYLAMAICASAVSSNAAISYGDPNIGQVYVGAKVGQIDTDKPKKATAYGVYAGYNIDRNLGAEIEYVTSKNADYSDGGLEHSYEASTYGVYGTYRYPINNTSFYVKGKLGIAKTKVDGTSGVYSQKAPIPGEPIRITGSYSTEKTGLAGGVSAGFNQGNIGVEAGYSYLNQDASLWGIGVHLAF